MAKPILADGDFVAWDIKTHTFVITPTAAKRIVESCFLRVVAFVMVCSGERVFAGLFETDVSSSSASVPVIMTDPVATQCFTWPTNVVLEGPFICTNLQEAAEGLFTRTNDHGARDRFMTRINPTTNVTLRIDWGYPSIAFARGEDRREDKRIAIAVEKLFGDATKLR